MDADWGEVTRFHFQQQRADSFLHSTIPTAIAFDTGAELLWVGQDFGRVASFFHNGNKEMERYTAFKASPHNQGAVRQFLFNDRGVICLSPQSVHMALRRGPPLWHINHEDMKDLRCMSFTSRGTAEILVAGYQDTMFVIDVNKGDITKQVPVSEHYSIMKKSRHICAATKRGSVDILDSISFKVTKTWNTQSAYINDMDVQQDFIVTCGASLKQSNYMFDPYVNVFDLKNMQSMAPIPFPPLAAFVRMHPKMVTTGIVVSQAGQMHVVDLLNPNTTNVRQANTTAYLALVDIAPSGQTVVIADSDGYLHLWAPSSKQLVFAENIAQLEFPTDEQEAPPQMDWSVETPLNTVGLTYYREELLSSWPQNFVSDVGAPPVIFDPNYLSGLLQSEFGLYGKNTSGLLRNQLQDTRSADRSSGSVQAPKFLSEKARETAKLLPRLSNGDPYQEDAIQSPIKTEIESLKAEVPNMYRSVEIKFSKFGVDDFDFGFYNRTRYAGLENHIANSYANSLLQVMHFTPILRNLSLQHAATACLSEQCLLCELGFLFDMLDKAKGATCQATNMLKMLTSHPGVGNLHLLEDDPHASSLAAMIQGLARFLLDQMCRDYMKTSPEVNVMEQATATTAQVLMKCMHCSSETARSSSSFVNDLVYPQMNYIRGRPPTATSFSDILKKSIEREQTARGWCTTCRGYQPLATRKTIKAIPQVLAANANISTADQKRLWATPGWLPEEIGVIIGDEHVYCFEGEDLKLHLQRAKHEIYVYSLIGVVVNIDRGPPHKPHLISMVNVAHSAPVPPEDSQWHLFNDFLVKPVSSKEALTFNTTWKTPLIVLYQLKVANNQIDSTWKQKLDISVLYQDQSPASDTKTYQVLDPSFERPGPETIVALDTEFVAVKQPEIEVNSDGERETIRPMIHSLARVSVVRGSGPRRGEPFIDDYILIKEPIVDYLTMYSGITPGDLDPRQSKHNLVSLKVAFKKLWVLLNLGCRFLGHGLRQDFRVINIQVPKAQVIDTINLFYLKARLRKLSLAFLASCLLKEDIQVDTHDSIEDSRTALELYRKYLEFEGAGSLDSVIDEIYRVGRESNFKPIRKDGQVVQRTRTPPNVEGRVLAPSTPSQVPVGQGQVPSGPFGGITTLTPG
ncbi:PAB-dependent poly(A)-specific ribonuclease subunit PAN2 [Gaeumannomyces tritici R3-111a-1]|uniref:PAN2-PAN3 deadenylation complex catalytic subunit PAN2 n=1 Tax=Gaeumannomyces tritici (strain R3-111a-1) TaxID=644352 RepID=J3NIW2_GAET3|nr:PAB-dependent poly(A)-specific ribonuclease subunit PAN2 [Gaeumannomyces tritici R3-111a-1]EJT81212.1 PAB-dependent poly(A)-specific ribonuclease subunit PAN2 [Gaeumannomyces tritici R3-111a-1]